MKREVVHYNDPVLRKKAEPIGEITDEVRQLAADLIDTCNAHNGIGIAAPQVGVSLRMFIVNLQDERNPEEMLPGHPLVLINPKLSKPSDDEWTTPEGCLSIPKLYGDVSRPTRITVSAMDLDGETTEREFVGWEARVVMHENDHLNGVLFIDRMDKRQRKELEPALKEIDRGRGTK